MAKKKVAETIVEVQAQDLRVIGMTVHWGSNSRTYTPELHGEDFAALAQEFATKRNGTLEPLS